MTALFITLILGILGCIIVYFITTFYILHLLILEKDDILKEVDESGWWNLTSIFILAFTPIFNTVALLMWLYQSSHKH